MKPINQLAIVAAATAISTAYAAPRQDSLHPETGQDCVTSAPSKRNTGSNSNFIDLRFQNICNRGFSVSVKYSSGKGATSGISRGSIAKPEIISIPCDSSKDNCLGAGWDYE